MHPHVRMHCDRGFSHLNRICIENSCNKLQLIHLVNYSLTQRYHLLIKRSCSRACRCILFGVVHFPVEIDPLRVTEANHLHTENTQMPNDGITVLNYTKPDGDS